MTFSTDQAIKHYTEMYTRWAVLKKENRLFRGDKEPTGDDFGLLPWVADQIKRRIDKEVNRTA